MTSNESDWTEITNKNLRTWGVVVKRESASVGTFAFNDTVTYIGRMPENHIVLEDPRISRSHAKVTCVGGQYLMEDQQSENGMVVNGQKVSQKWLQLKDKVELGEFVLEVTDKLEGVEIIQKPEPSIELEDRTLNIVELKAPSDASIVLNIAGQTHMHRITFSDVESAQLAAKQTLTVSLVVESGGTQIKKTLTISNPS